MGPRCWPGSLASCIFTQIGLADAKPLGNGAGGHPDVDAEAGHIRVPHVLFDVEPCQVPGNGKVPADGLADPFAVEGTGQIVDDIVGNGPVILVSHIDGGNKLIALFQHRIQQKFDPFRRDAS